MNGPGVEVEGGSRTVLVFEFVTGGGLAGRDLPVSWAAEGSAMRRAIVGDFAAVPGVRVVTTVDARLPSGAIPGVEVRVVGDGDPGWFESLAAGADYTVLIAPETDGHLETLASVVEAAGGRSLGSSPEAIDLAGDKLRLALLLAHHGIPTPPTRAIGSSFADFPSDWVGPIVIKPRRGAGSIDTFVVLDRRCPPFAGRDRTFVAQPYLPGEPMSASFLVDDRGNSTLLAIGRQEIIVEEGGGISYRGGTIPSRDVGCPSAVLKAIDVVVGPLPKPSLRGFVGVDFLIEGRGRAVVLEINPRPTTSYVGLAHLFPPGVIAGAWLAAVAGPLEGTAWPDRLRIASNAPVVSFIADGTIRPPPGDSPR